MQIDPNDRFLIKNTHTGNIVESQKTSEYAIANCNFLNRHIVEWNKSFPRCIVIDKLTGEKFYTDLEYKL
jgi:predicted glycosyltransferase involved in capsule biosynthesis